MNALKRESERFLEDRRALVSEAHGRAALQLLCGIDMDALARALPQERQRLIARIDRALQRERLKGLRRHWSYDLNRHIALKQARDRLVSEGMAGAESGKRKPKSIARRSVVAGDA